MNQIFNNVSSERIYQKIVEQIRGLIDEGKLKPGDRLPSERDLAEILGCSRASLREAFRVLEAEGVLVTKQGEGRFIQELAEFPQLDYRYNPIHLVEKSAILSFLEAREVLEPKIAELAARRAAPRHLEKMKKVLHKLEESFKNREDKVESDSAFHIAMAEATQNFVFVSMLETNLSMIRQVRRTTLVQIDRHQKALDEHWAIYYAIEAKDPDRAREAVNYHIGQLREAVINGWDTNGDI